MFQFREKFGPMHNYEACNFSFLPVNFHSAKCPKNDESWKSTWRYLDA